MSIHQIRAVRKTIIFLALLWQTRKQGLKIRLISFVKYWITITHWIMLPWSWNFIQLKKMTMWNFFSIKNSCKNSFYGPEIWNKVWSVKYTQVTRSFQLGFSCLGIILRILWSKYEMNTTCTSWEITFFVFLGACLFWSVKYVAQGKKSDKVDFLNPDILSFPTVYNKSLSKFFLGRPKILQDY